MPQFRSANYHEYERYLLIELIMRYPHTTSKKQDGQSCRVKSFAWHHLTMEFNAKNISSPRTVQNLKDLWKNMKSMTRRELIEVHTPVSEGLGMENSNVDCTTEITPADVLATLNKRRGGKNLQELCSNEDDLTLGAASSGIAVNALQWNYSHCDEKIEHKYSSECCENSQSCSSNETPTVIEKMGDAHHQSKQDVASGNKITIFSTTPTTTTSIVDSLSEKTAMPPSFTKDLLVQTDTDSFCGVTSPSSWNAELSEKRCQDHLFGPSAKLCRTSAADEDCVPQKPKALHLDGAIANDFGTNMIGTATLKSVSALVNGQNDAIPPCSREDNCTFRPPVVVNDSRGRQKTPNCPEGERSQPDIVANHNNAKPGGGSSKTRRCEPCEIVFPDNIMFGLHKACHTAHDPFKCNICGKVCSDKYDFTFHISMGEHDNR